MKMQITYEWYKVENGKEIQIEEYEKNDLIKIAMTEICNKEKEGFVGGLLSTKLNNKDFDGSWDIKVVEWNSSRISPKKK